MLPPLLVSNPIHLRYLTGVSLSTGMLIWTPKKMTLFVDGRYTEKAKTGVRKRVFVRSMNDVDAAVSRFRRLRFEAEDVSVARLARWKKRFRGTTLIPSTDIIEEMRRMKKPNELKAIKNACRITDKILTHIGAILTQSLFSSERSSERSVEQASRETVRLSREVTMGLIRKWPLLTERSLAWHIEKLAHELGADGLAFDSIVAFGENTSIPHHTPTNRQLKSGDLIQIDMGVKVNGYCSDCSRVFFTAEPTEEQKRVFDLLLRIVKETTVMAKPGVMTLALDRYARRKLKKHDLDRYFLHSLGHGVGLEIHEGVSLTSRKGAKTMRLKENEIITIEPGVYFAGKWGMRIEDTILVTSKEAHRLTKNSY